MSTSKSGGCGCAACGTGSGTCAETSFKRPRFFAGQLLTEDDLQAMMDYVVGKNRLHNRYLFGEGVVCGLSVTCHPCGGGQVVVAPGFALDCCGNDLVLPCAETLDTAALLRDLRKRQLNGYECGDPCDKEVDRRKYGLYLTYKETPADPVAPYTSGDPCGQQGCEPTRIQEGYGFELRCDCTPDRQAGLYARIFACIGDVKSATLAIVQAGLLYDMAMDIKRGPTIAANGTIAGPTQNEIREMRIVAVGLKTWLLNRLEQSNSRTRCDLYDRVKAVHLDAADAFAEGGDKAREEADHWLDLVRVLLEYFIDCACLALNPPCSPCDDTALLLACVELDGCDVIDLCNMSRTFVLSPAAMRYWLPVNLIGDALKTLCCNLDLSGLFEVEQERGRVERPPVPPQTPGMPTENVAMGKAPASAVKENARLALEKIGISAEQAVDGVAFSKSLAGLAMRVGQIDTSDLRYRTGAVTDELAVRFRPAVADMARKLEVREAVSAIVKEELASSREAVVTELRDHVGAEAKDAVGTLSENVSAEVGAKLTDDLSKKVSNDVERSVTSAVAKEMTATKLNTAVDNLAVVKALRKENAALATRLDKLHETVKKLGGTT
jgi:hypothetical protein